MNPIVISPEIIKSEIRFLIVAFVLANLMNIYAIISYETSWIELISSLHILILLSFVLYFLILIARGLFKLVRLLIKK
jgi:hypothetical protein